jgi:hypothetical protein
MSGSNDVRQSSGGVGLRRIFSLELLREGDARRIDVGNRKAFESGAAADHVDRAPVRNMRHRELGHGFQCLLIIERGGKRRRGSSDEQRLALAVPLFVVQICGTQRSAGQVAKRTRDLGLLGREPMRSAIVEDQRGGPLVVDDERDREHGLDPFARVSLAPRREKGQLVDPFGGNRLARHHWCRRLPAVGRNHRGGEIRRDSRVRRHMPDLPHGIETPDRITICGDEIA